MFKLLRYLILVIVVGLIIYYFLPEKKMPENTTVDKIEVFKSRNLMYVYSQNKMIKEYSISIGSNSYGDKEFEGDKKTPEGIYKIESRNPNSSFYKNLGISYPNNDDREYSAKLGKSAGGEIKIHGLKNGIGFISKFHRITNWTNGCIAVTNDEMDELYKTVKTGATIIIKP